MASEFNVDAVKACILDRGGRIRNHELVTHFKHFLNHPDNKGINREKFKDFVNELATIKVEEGEKILVLKRKHRPESAMSPSSSSSSSSLASNRSSTLSTDHTVYQPSPAKAPYQPQESNTSYPSPTREASYPSPQPRQSTPPQPQPREAREAESPPFTPRPAPRDQEAYLAEAARARSEPPSAGAGQEQRERDLTDGGFMSKVHMSDENLDVRLKSSTRPGVGPGGSRASFQSSTPSLASGGSQGSLSSAAEVVSGSGEEEGGNMSVMSIKERVAHMDKISSQTDIQQMRVPTSRSKKPIKDRDDDDESYSSGGTGYVSLTPEEKEWMLVSATADYHEMFRLLSRNSRLAKVKEIANGYTALHWAAKFGKPEVVKMLANKIGVNVNQRSYGGYTPLHLAAIHGHEDIIELLVSVYKADNNMRDYSGKKAKQYLKNSASSRAQQLLVSRRLGPNFAPPQSLDDSFTRSVTSRQSNRARALSSLIGATSSVMRQPILRSSWEGAGSDEGGDKTPGSTPPSSSSSSPIGGRRYKDDKHLMPPPHIANHRRRRGDNRSRSSSRESLNSQSQSQSTSAMDKENNNQTVPRSESDPSLSRKTFI